MSDLRTYKRMVWSGQVSQDFCNWTDEGQDAVKAFVIAHGIDICYVPTDDTTWTVYLVDDQFELTLWLQDKEDGKIVICPYCPECVKRRKVTMPLLMPPPRMANPWITDDPQLLVRLASVGDSP